MAPFTRMQTQMVEKSYLMQALADLGYTCEEGHVEIRGYSGNRRRVEIKVTTKNPGSCIGLRNAAAVPTKPLLIGGASADTNQQTRRQRWRSCAERRAAPSPASRPRGRADWDHADGPGGFPARTAAGARDDAGQRVVERCATPGVARPWRLPEGRRHRAASKGLSMWPTSGPNRFQHGKRR